MKKFFSLERQVGFIFATILLLISLAATTKILLIIAISLAILMITLTFVKPNSLSTVATLWVLFGGFLGKIVTPIILFIIYIISIITTSLILKLFNIRLMDLKFDKTKSSYWDTRSPETSDMKNQF